MYGINENDFITGENFLEQFEKYYGSPIRDYEDINKLDYNDDFIKEKDIVKYYPVIYDYTGTGPLTDDFITSKQVEFDPTIFPNVAFRWYTTYWNLIVPGQGAEAKQSSDQCVKITMVVE